MTQTREASDTHKDTHACTGTGMSHGKFTCSIDSDNTVILTTQDNSMTLCGTRLGKELHAS